MISSPPKLRRSVRRTGGGSMSAPSLNPREEPATGRRLPPLAIKTAATVACRTGDSLFNRAETGESRPFGCASRQRKCSIAMVYTRTLRSGIRCNNRSVTGSDFALIRAITGGVLAITGKGDFGRRKRAGGSENGLAGTRKGARKDRYSILSPSPSTSDSGPCPSQAWEAAPRRDGGGSTRSHHALTDPTSAAPNEKTAFAGRDRFAGGARLS